MELEPTPEGQLRQHLQQQEHGTRYDYISFSGNAAMVNKTLRSTLPHLHVALGHVTNDKLKRMLLNGAKPELASIIDHLECQICKQMKTPMATPKAAFQRPMQFNERIVADSFYIWDSENTKYAVARIGHVLPVPDCGGSSRPFLRSDNCTITRSMDWGFWTAGSFDDGSGLRISWTVGAPPDNVWNLPRDGFPR